MYWRIARLADEATPSIAGRLAALFAFVACVGFGLLSATLYWVLSNELDRHQVDQINSRMEDMRYMLEHARSPGVAQRAHAKMDALTPVDGRTRYWMWSSATEYRYGQDLDYVLAATRGKTEMVDWFAGDRHMRLVGVDIPATEDRPAVRLMLGMDHGPFARTLHRFALVLVLLTLLGTLAVVSAGYWVTRLGLAPVRRMSDEAHRIKPGNRSSRLKLTVLPPELANLGFSFNAALDRLDAAYHQLETFNDNAAHELRTPLANLIGQTQVALSRERDSRHLREVLQSNLEELERLRKIVADMLFLARAEQGARASQLINAQLSHEVGKTVDFLEFLLDEAAVSVRVEGDAQAPIETSLFRRALINLLQNAISHSSVGSEIVVSLHQLQEEARIEVSNAGPAIAPKHLPHLFDRFYRVETSRDKSSENHGLGLAIVKAVATMHKGTTFAFSENGRTTIGFSLGL
jgi:two-component system, OmpR family, heavy metal sensor histidine kinase CusS